MKITVSESKCLVFLLLVQFVMMLIVQPSGNFPLNDDWAYAHSVEWLLSEQRIRLSDWIAPNLLPQTVLGAAVTALAGFSFETLRHLTQFLALLTSFAAFYWFRAGRLSPAESLIACLVLISMPSWPVLANSYMSDMYGMLFGVTAATLFLRSLAKPSTKLVISATVVVCLGMLQRQVLLVIPFAFMLGWYWQQRHWTPKIMILGVIPLILTITTELLYYNYLSTGPGVPAAQIYGNGRFLSMFMQALLGEDDIRQYVWSNFITMTGYLGLFVAAWCTWWGIQSSNVNICLYSTVLVVLIAVTVLAIGWFPPYLDNNTIDRAGIGPFTLYDGLPRELVQQQRQPGIIWRLAGVVASVGMIAVATLAIKSLAIIARGRDHADGETVFILAIIVAYVGPFLITGYFDRYLLFILPFILILWSHVWPKRGNSKVSKIQCSLAMIWTGAVLALSSIATHDYFAWNQARWAAISHAESIGATPETLDGGFEYNGYYRFEQQPRKRVKGKSFWWVRDDEYVVTFTEVPGYSLVQEFPVSRYSKRTQPKILLMHRKAPEH